MHLGRRRAPLDRDGRGRPHVDGERRDRRDRPAPPARVAEHPRPRGLRGPQLPLRPVGPRLRPARQARRRHRHRRERRAVRADGRRRGARTSPSSSARATGTCRAATARTRRSRRSLFEHVPGLQALRRRYIFKYTESVTLLIRHPRTLGRLGRLCVDALHAPPDQGPGPAAAHVARLHVRLQADPLHARTSCRRSSSRTPSSSPTRSRRVDATGVVTADGTHHDVDCIIYGTGFKTSAFMFPMEITGAGGRVAARGLGRRRARAHGHRGPRLPVAVLHVRAEHEHLGRLDHRLRGGAVRLHPPGAAARARRAAPRRSRCAPRSRPRATARCRRASPAPRGWSATPGTATSTAGSSRTGRATCASTSRRRRTLDPSEYALLPQPDREEVAA